MCESNTFSRLNHSSITSIVSDRIFPDHPTQDEVTPYIAYYRTDTAPVTCLDASIPITNYQVQVDVVCRNQSEARSLANAVRARLHGSWDGGEKCYWMQEGAVTTEDHFAIAQSFSLWIN